MLEGNGVSTRFSAGFRVSNRVPHLSFSVAGLGEAGEPEHRDDPINTVGLCPIDKLRRPS